jgi:type VI protein secretion system component VasF
MHAWIARLWKSLDAHRHDDRGDVPGWVLITLMTAGLVAAIWAIAGPLLTSVFTEAIEGVTGA